ncbi:MAG: T9SS type A sorting domain-containing protein, partial [Candidatus Cloacimonadota bacterium]
DDSISFTSFNNAWCVASDINIVHVVWFDDRDGNPEIYYKRSTDGGTIWQADTRLTDDSLASWSPCIVVSGPNVHIVWGDKCNGNIEIYYKHSFNGGITWGLDTRLTSDSALSDIPSMAISDSFVHVVWTDYRDLNFEVYCKHSSDNGTTWGTDTNLSNDSAFSWYPSIAVSESNIHVVWYDTRDGNAEIYYKRSTDAGTTWETEIRLTNDDAGSRYPSVAVSGSTVHVAWSDNRDGIRPEIYYKRSTNEGITWEADDRLTNDAAWSSRSSLAVSGSNVHLVWNDDRNGNPEIYYMLSTDDGISWEIETRLTDDSLWSEYPSVAVSGCSIHVVWQDNRDGNDEIYYKRNPTGNAVYEEENKNFRHKITNLKLLCYPTPFTSEFSVKCSGGSDKQKVTLQVYNVSGRLVKSVPLTTNHLSLGTDLIPGIYFLKADGKPVGKVVKVR